MNKNFAEYLNIDENLRTLKYIQKRGSVLN